MATQPHTPAGVNNTPVPSIGLPPMPAVSRILAGFQRDQLASFVEVAIGLLNIADPDPDEPNFAVPQSDGLPGDPDDHENGDDAETASWIEYHGRTTPKVMFTAGHEDDEDADPREDDDPDHGIDDLPHDQEQDAEVEQMPGDVPVLPVHSLEFNVFNDQRTYLGRSNLMTSFRTNGGKELSADTGAELISKGWVGRDGGIPV